MWRIQETIVSWLYRKLRGRWHNQKRNKMNLCIIYIYEWIFTIWCTHVLSFSNCIRFSNESRTADSSSFVLSKKISVGQKLKWFKAWNVVFETLALFGPGGDRILLGTDARYPSRTHTASVILTGAIFPLLLLKHGRRYTHTDMLQNPIHFRRNIIIVINFTYQLRSNFSRVILELLVVFPTYRDSPRGGNNDQYDQYRKDRMNSSAFN